MKHPVSRLAFGALCAALLWTAGFQPARAAQGLDTAAPWPCFGHDPQHTGRSPYTGPTFPMLRWTFTFGNTTSSFPAIATDGSIYISMGGYLEAFNPDGTHKWYFNTYGPTDGSPAIAADGTLYVGSYGKALYAVNPDGKQKWVFRIDAFIASSPMVGADGAIYVGSSNGKFYAVNPDGTQKWVLATGDAGFYSSPAIGADGTLYVGSYDNKKLYAINPDGTQKWTFATGGPIYSSPAIGADGTIYIGSYDKELYAVNPDGTQKWSFPVGAAVLSSPAIGTIGTVYIGSEDNQLYAINPDGTQRWAFRTGGMITSSPMIGADGTVYVGSGDKKIYAINADGTQKWAFTTGGAVNSSPTLGADGTLYVGAGDNKLYAIAPAIIITPATASVPAGATQQFSADPGKGVTWSTTGGSIDATGLYTAPVKAGEYTITAKTATQTGNVTVKVTASLSITPTGGTLVPGASLLFAAAPDPDKVTWSASDGTIDATGFFTAPARPGTYTVTATGAGPDDTPGRQTATAIVTVTAHIPLPPPALSAPWPMVGHDAQHTGSSPYTGPTIPVQKWAFAADGGARSSAIAADGTLYVVTEKKLYALHPDGTQKWVFATDSYITTSPAISGDGTVYVCSENKKLYAINPDGTLKWAIPIRIGWDDSPTIGADGTVYLGSDKLYAINPDGTQKWAYSTSDNVYWRSPAIGADGTLYAGLDGKGILYALNANGKLKWTFTTYHPVGMSCFPPVLSYPCIGTDGTIYVAAGGDVGQLFAITPAGTQKWASDIDKSGGTERPCALTAGGTIYVLSYRELFQAFNADGTEKWVRNDVAYVQAPIIGADGTIYTCGYDGFHALNPDGTQKWVYDRICSSPVIGADGTLYVVTGDDKGGSKFLAIGDATPFAITPVTVTLAPGATQQFMVNIPDRVVWKAEGGKIDAMGLFTAGTVPGTYTVTAALGDKVATFKVTITGGMPVP